MAGMLGGKKNRCTHGALECPWGCCRSLQTGSKKKTKRVLRTREKREWQGRGDYQ